MDDLVFGDEVDKPIEVVDIQLHEPILLCLDDLLDDEVEEEGNVPLKEEVVIVLHEGIPLLLLYLIVVHDHFPLFHYNNLYTLHSHRYPNLSSRPSFSLFHQTCPYPSPDSSCLWDC